jgi:transposase InsO family protein
MRVSILCTIAGVSTSGYYTWLTQINEPQKDHRDYLLIKEIFDKGKSKWGFRTIHMKLCEKNICMNHKKILRIMNKYKLYTKIRKANPYKQIMKKTLEHRVCENLLDRNFHQSIPYTVFCTDITYIFFNYRFVYLSVIKDIATGEIVGWKLSRNITMELVLGTLSHMKNNLSYLSLKKIMIHSDQGFHYTNPRYQEMVQSLGMIQSMSRKGNCIDNAPIESFFGHFKDDIEYKDCKTFEDLYLIIEQYMKYYNHERQQWGLKKMTPVKYRDHLLMQEHLNFLSVL